MMNCQISENELIFLWQIFFNSINVKREKRHAEQRNSRIDQQLDSIIISICCAWEIYSVERMTMVIRSLGSNYTYVPMISRCVRIYRRKFLVGRKENIFYIKKLVWQAEICYYKSMDGSDVMFDFIDL